MSAIEIHTAPVSEWWCGCTLSTEANVKIAMPLASMNAASHSALRPGWGGGAWRRTPAPGTRRTSWGRCGAHLPNLLPRMSTEPSITGSSFADLRIVCDAREKE